MPYGTVCDFNNRDIIMKILTIIFFTFIISFNIHSTNKSREQIVRELFSSVEKWMGTPYVYGGDSRSGIDCSAFTNRVYTEVFNHPLPRTVANQRAVGTTVSGTLQPGDLLFFNIDGRISHVGIYVFDNKFIHAASAGPQVGVIKSSLNEKYYRNRYVFAKRVVNLPQSSGGVLASNQTDEKRQAISNLTLSGTRIPSDNMAIKESSDTVLFKLGAVIYNGSVRDFNNTFSETRDIVFSIKNINHDRKHFIISIFNLETERERKIHLFDIRKEREITRAFNLAKGNYSIRLVANQNDLLYEKNISVF